MVDEMVTVSKMINATINVTVSHTLNERIGGLAGNKINLQALKWQEEFLQKYYSYTNMIHFHTKLLVKILYYIDS